MREESGEDHEATAELQRIGTQRRSRAVSDRSRVAVVLDHPCSFAIVVMDGMMDRHVIR